MKKTLSLVAVGLLLVLVGSAVVSAQDVPMYYAVNIPDSELPTIDGDVSDWAWVPSSYVITTDMLGESLLNPVEDAADLSVTIWLGWNATTNMLYGAASVVDNDRVGDLSMPIYMVDAMETFLDPSHSGLGPWSEVDVTAFTVVQPVISLDETDALRYDVMRFDEDLWWKEAPHTYIANEWVDAHTRNYEFAYSLYAPLAPDEASSVRWQMAADQVMGFAISISDADLTGLNQGGNAVGTDNNYWQSYLSMSHQFMNRGGIADLYLSPPGAVALESATWGTIKALLR